MNGNQVILACDERGNFIEYIPKMEGHIGVGKRHLGITILLFNDQGEILSQRRKHLVFDNVWCFTADTHQLHKPHSRHSEERSPLRLSEASDVGISGADETIEAAAKRCLAVEYGITATIPTQNLGGYNYAAQDGELCEKEFCLMIIGEYDGDLQLNPAVGYEYMWLSKSDFLKDVEEHPQKYAPWVKGGIEVLKEHNFFDNQ